MKLAFLVVISVQRSHFLICTKAGKIYFCPFQVKAVFTVDGKQVQLFQKPDHKEAVTNHTVSDILSLHAKLLYGV